LPVAKVKKTFKTKAQLLLLSIAYRETGEIIGAALSGCLSAQKSNIIDQLRQNALS